MNSPKPSKFKKSLLIYISILSFLSLAFVLYIYILLVNYEENDIDQYLTTKINNLTKQELTNFLKENGKDKNLASLYEKIIKNKKYKFIEKEKNVYDAYLDEYLMFTITTKIHKTVNRFGLIKYDVLRTDNIIPNLKRGLVYYDIKIPSNYKLYIDDTLITSKDQEEKYPNLDYLYHAADMPSLVSYKINDLTGKEKIEVLDFNNNKVDLIKNNYQYTLSTPYITLNNYEEAIKYLNGEIDILSIAKNWSLFLTKDLEGPINGFSKIDDYLIKDTEIYKSAYKWATGVDITFTSKHTLKKNPFQKEKVTNFVIYDKNVFSCDVYLEKHLQVSGKKKEEIDVMNDTLYFLKEKNEWKLVNIKPVSSGHNE